MKSGGAASLMKPSIGGGASSWRTDALLTFEARAREVGLQASAEYEDLLRQMLDATASLELLEAAQQAGETAIPWWADGEYDVGRADIANDEGVSFHKHGEYAKALNCFTEAIRLHPSTATYHANRAAAALKLHQFHTALQDARMATDRDPAYLKAHLRAADALLKLGRPHEALHAYQEGQRISPSNTAAQAGSRLAAADAALHESAQGLEASTALQGTCRFLPLEGMGEDCAADLLLSAQAILAACPMAERAKTARVEALIMCQRYADARAAASELLPGVDRLYLEADASWRAGALPEALAALQGALAISAGSRKCSERLHFLQPIQQLDASSLAAYDAGRFQDSIDDCSTALFSTAHCACSGLRCFFLCRRSSGHLKLHNAGEALADCSTALSLDPAHVECLHLLTQIRRDRGDHVEAFLAVQQLAAAAPSYSGLALLQQDLGALALRAQRRDHAHCSTFLPQRDACSNAGSLYEELDIRQTASAQEIRSAFRHLASKWHPDKWLTAPLEEQHAAAAKYGSICEAYATLGNMDMRSTYDAEHMY